jgi:hypothetical protein
MINQSPYFDDFDPKNNYHSVLFKPGFPIQARELNVLQSTIHDQIKILSDSNYKNGDLIEGGEVVYDNNVDTVKLQLLYNSNKPDTTATSLIGKIIVGNTTNIRAVVLAYINDKQSIINTPTLYVKYVSSGRIVSGVQYTEFADNEVLSINNVGFALTTTNSATEFQASLVHINDAKFYYDGYYVDFSRSSIIIEQYSTLASVKVGIKFNKSIVDNITDPRLNDNSAGFTNCSGAGADRLKITPEILTVPYSSITTPTNFTEIIKIKSGVVEYTIDQSISNQIVDAVAKRTYETSGNYTTNDFKLNTEQTLNNLFNNGTYNVNDVINEKTILNREPLFSETNSINGAEYISVELSPGQAVIKGYDYNYAKKQIINIQKALDTDTKTSQLLMNNGSYFNINNILGTLDLTTEYKTIQLWDKLFSNPNKKLLGTAKCVSILTYNNTNRAYIIDLTTHTRLVTSGLLANLVYGDYVEGKISGATGYVYSVGGGAGVITIENKTGAFIPGEDITNSRNDVELTIVSSLDYTIDNIKSISDASGFNASVVQNQILVKGSNYNVSGNTIVGNNVDFLSEFSIGSSVSIGNITGTVLTIPNKATITTDTVFPSQAINAIYKLITVVNGNNRQLYQYLPNKEIKQTANRTLSVTKYAVVSFINGSATVPNQTSSEVIGNTTVLVQTSGGSIVAKFVTNSFIQTQNDPNPSGYTGVGFISYENQLTAPYINNMVLEKNKVVRYNRQKSSTPVVPYAIRYDDNELSLGFTNVTKILAVRYSQTDKTSNNYTNTCFDTITLANATQFNISDIVYNKEIKAKIIEKTGSVLTLIYLSDLHFQPGDNIIDWNNQVNSIVTSTTSGSYIDVTNNYKLVSNQTDTVSDISKLKIINSNNKPTNDVVVVFDYYNTGSGDVVTVDSYNDTVSETNIIDFRFFGKSPIINGLGTISSPYILTNSNLNPTTRDIKFKTVVAPETIFKCDYDYYLNRRDLAIIDVDGTYKILSGVSAELPAKPEAPKESLILADIYLPAKTLNLSEVQIVLQNNTRYTMEDIGNIEKRVSNVETEIALNKLELSANNTILADNNGNLLLKTGFVVDEFISTSLSDTNNVLYRSSIDVHGQTLRPSTNTENIELDILPSINNSYTKTNSLISLPFVETTFVEQTKGDIVTVANPYTLTNWEGLLNTYPSNDNWYVDKDNEFIYENWYPNITTQPNLAKNKRIADKLNKNIYLRQQTIKLNIESVKPNTKLNITINSISVDNLTIPSKCSVIKDGSNGTNNIAFIVGESLLWENVNTRSIVGSQYQPRVYSKYTEATVGNGVYAGNSNILNINWNTGYNFDIEDIGVGTYIIGVTSGAKAIVKNTDIISDDNGNFSGNIFIPSISSNYKFATGKLVIKATGVNTFAENVFQCGGSTITDDKNIVSLRVPETNDTNITSKQITGSNITKSNNWNNPLSQTFINNEIGGCFVTSLELYFTSKDNFIPIIIQLRTIENNYPTEIIIPLSEISVNPSSINVSSDGRIATKITFKDIVYIKENVQYAISILTNSNNYKLLVGKFGSKDKNVLIEKNPNIGSLYLPQNTKVWVADQTKAIKFKLNKALFNTSGKVTLCNSNNQSENSNSYITTTKLSNLVNVYSPNHGLHSINNRTRIANVKSDTKPTILTTTIADAQYITSSSIFVESPQLIPTIINNLPISNINPGYLKINEEIVSYIAVDNNTKAVTVPAFGRGINNTQIKAHLANTVIENYSIFGIPLTELNTTFNTIVPIDLDNFGVYTISNANITGTSNKNIYVSRNKQYESITPNISYKYYPNTNITAKLIATTATSIGVNVLREPSFLQFIKDISLTDNNKFNRPLMVATKENEQLLQQKSLITEVTLSSTNPNLSPIIDFDKCSMVATTNRINVDQTTNELLPNQSKLEYIYITKPISLILPSQGITIIFDAIKAAEHSIKVYIKIAKENNLPEFDKNNFIEIPAIIYPSGDTFKEYKYQLRDISQYKNFQIKISSTSSTQANYPEIKNLRIISTAT